MKNKKHKPPNEKTIKMPLRRFIENQVYMMKVVHSVDKTLLPVTLLRASVSAVMQFLSSAFLLRYVLNAIGEGRGFSEVVYRVVLFFVVELSIHIGDNLLWRFYYPKRNIELSRRLNEKIFRQAVSVETACYENPEFYNNFVKACAEADNRAYNLLLSLGGLLSTVISVVLSVVLVIDIHPILLIFAFIPLVTIPVKARYNKAVFERDTKITEIDRTKNYSRRTFYLADYAKEMRLTNMPVLMLKRFRESSQRCLHIWKTVGGLTAVLETISFIFGDVLPVTCATVIAVYLTIVEHEIGFGDCFVVLSSLGVISGNLTRSVADFLHLQNHALFIENLRVFLEYEPKIKDGDRPLPEAGDIVLDNVSFRYDGSDNYVLKNISMRIGKNEKIAIVGSNGAGKTTLTKLLLRLYDGTEGDITYNGKSIKDFRLSDYRDMFSTVMQDYHMFALSVAENVKLAAREPGDEAVIEEALKKSGIYDKIMTHPDGMEAEMTREFDENGVLLSGGEAQKIAIAHVYAKDNRFVILDEPSSALDPIAEYQMYENMLAACEGCGMVFISHRLSSATLADRIYLMDNGEVVEVGSHAELMQKGGQYAEMFARQAQNYANEADCEVSRA